MFLSTGMLNPTSSYNDLDKLSSKEYMLNINQSNRIKLLMLKLRQLKVDDHAANIQCIALF